MLPGLHGAHGYSDRDVLVQSAIEQRGHAGQHMAGLGGTSCLDSVPAC